MSGLDIITNVISDFIFVLVITLLLLLTNWIHRCGRLNKAQRFFGFDQQTQVSIYVSCFEHSGMSTKGVVNAQEYETAIEMRNALQQIQRRGVAHKLRSYLAGLIGIDLSFPEPAIKISPLEGVTNPPCCPGNMILIGGPVNNQLTKFHMQASSQIRFNENTEKYQKRDGKSYQDIEPSGDVAVVERLVIEKQVVILTHGFGEEQTRRAVRYLIAHWERLHNLHVKHGRGEFSILV